MTTIIPVPTRTRGRQLLAAAAILLGIIGLLASLVAVLVYVRAPAAVPYRYAPADPASAVITYKGNVSRTGGYLHETLLTTQNVNANRFGKRVSYPVDGQVYAQPLYAPNVPIGGKPYNVVYVATEHDSVYALDADQTSSAPPLWRRSFTGAGASAVRAEDLFVHKEWTAIRPEVGITGTPAIDLASQTLYIVAMTMESGQVVQRLHALDITTGAERQSAVISAQVPGSGIDALGGAVTFNSLRQLQRAALLLVNGVVYAAWASFGDADPFHGWILGYDATTLRQVAALNVTPNGTEGGIWGAGDGLAASPDGTALFCATGNGDFDLSTGGSDAGDSVIRLDPQLHILDYFAPANQAYLSQHDLDVGSGGIVVLPTQTGAAHPDLVLIPTKDGSILLLDQHHLGGFAGTAATATDPKALSPNAAQNLPRDTLGGGGFSAPAYWKGPSAQYVYFTALKDHIKAYTLQHGLLSAAPSSQTPEAPFGYPGGNVAVSSNGDTAGTGIAWVITPNDDARKSLDPPVSGTLRAYDATDLGHELYQAPLSTYIKFTTPTVANGEVFVPTANSLEIFGILH